MRTEIKVLELSTNCKIVDYHGKNNCPHGTTYNGESVIVGDLFCVFCEYFGGRINDHSIYCSYSGRNKGMNKDNIRKFLKECEP